MANYSCTTASHSTHPINTLLLAATRKRLPLMADLMRPYTLQLLRARWLGWSTQSYVHGLFCGTLINGVLSEDAKLSQTANESWSVYNEYSSTLLIDNAANGGRSLQIKVTVMIISIKLFHPYLI